MRQLLTILLALLLFAVVPAQADEAPPEVCNLAETALVEFGSDSIIVEAVRQHNARGVTMEEIKTLDRQWVAHPGMSAHMTMVHTTPLSMYLRGYKLANEHMSEIFVMGRLGENVAMTDKTSDFWQGDEDKFIRAFADGKGNLFIDEITFDRSSQAYVTHVSVPVMDGDRAIGVIAFGVDVDCF